MRNENCKLCPLHKGNRNVCIDGEGPEDARVMLIGEAPGHEEDKQGRPFVGKSGRIIRHEIEQAGLRDVRITNLVRCRPPGNRDPTNDEIKACRPYLEAELERIKPEYVVALGRISSKAVLKKSKITQDHGLLVRSPKFSYVGMPIFHPAYILRDPSKLPAMQRDLQRLVREIRGERRDDKIEWDFLTKTNLHHFVREFEAAERFSFDTETTGLFMHDQKGKVRTLQIGLDHRTWVIRLNMTDSPMPKHETQYQFLYWLGQAARGKWACAQNGKFDNQWLMRYYGLRFYLDFDTQLAHHLLNENDPHDLKSMARTYLDAPDYDLPLNELLNPEKYGKLQAFYLYSARDAHYTLKLATLFNSMLKKDRSLRRIFYSLVMPAARAFEEIEMSGITLDMEKFDQTEIEVRAKRDACLGELNKMARKAGADDGINWDSPQQVGRFLYGTLGIEPTVLTDGGAPSTGEEALLEIKDQHPVASKLVEYRELAKFLSTYLEGWREYIVKDRVYFSTKLHGTVTGRYSSRLHQVPRDGTIRNLAIAPKDFTFVQADISQAEVRTAAEASHDHELIKCFQEKTDIHWRTLMHNLATGASDEYSEPAMETAALYCVRHGLLADRTSAEILLGVWRSNKNRDTTESLLKTSIEISENRGWVRGQSIRLKESHVERWMLSDDSQKTRDEILQSVRQYLELRLASQGRQSSKQSKVEFDSALPLLSSIGPSISQEIWKGWKEGRKKAKGTVFGFLYGMGAAKFVEYAKLKYGFEPTLKEAENMREAFFTLYRGLEPWHKRQRGLVRLNGEVRNLIGRVRRLPGAQSSDRALSSEAERQAINSPIQGFIGDYKAMALVEIHELPRYDVIIVGEVHDSILLNVRTSALDEYLPKIRQIMRHPKLLDEFGVKLSIPMEADIELGPWGAGKPYRKDLEKV